MLPYANQSRRIADSSTSTGRWTRRLIIALTILAWLGLGLVVLWLASHIISSLLLLAIAALLAYAIAPLVKFLERAMPRFVAIIIVYLVVLSALSFLLYLVISTSIQQIGSLAQSMQTLVTSPKNGQPAPIVVLLENIGIPQSQIDKASQQLVSQAEGVATSAVPFISSLFGAILNIIIVAVLSIYLLVDGSRVTHWLRDNMPEQQRVDFFLNTLQRVVGGYIRSQLLVSLMIGLLVGVGMALLRVPYAVLLGVMAFVLEFIPILGTLLSGVICVLIALTQGWALALGVLAYFLVVHILEGYFIEPRLVGKAVGLHPVVAIFALLAGSEVFGIWGALFASPLAGLLQALLVAIWTHWRETHPREFQQQKSELAGKLDDKLIDKPSQQPEEIAHPETSRKSDGNAIDSAHQQTSEAVHADE